MLVNLLASSTSHLQPREYFYDDVLQATQRAINDGKIRVKVEINIPELNPEQDVYRIGTLMELVHVLALSFADDGKRVKDQWVKEHLQECHYSLQGQVRFWSIWTGVVMVQWATLLTSVL